MIKLARLSASSIALMLALLTGSAHGQTADRAPDQNAAFDADRSDPRVAAALEEQEEALDEFFEASEIEKIQPPKPRLERDVDIRAGRALLDRADRETSEFDDIGDDNISALNPAQKAERPRLNKPGLLEKDLPVNCPVGTIASGDGTCLAGADWTFGD